jgi:hypothetical protein
VRATAMDEQRQLTGDDNLEAVRAHVRARKVEASDITPSEEEYIVH